MNAEAFKNIAEGIQGLAIALATLVGGGWALYTFWALGAVKKAELEQLEIERRSRQEPVLAISLGSKVLSTSQDGCLLTIEAELRNQGARSLKVEIAEDSFLVSAVEVTAEGLNVRSPVSSVGHVILREDGSLEPVTHRLLRSGQARTVPFLLKVTAGEEYMVQFFVLYKGVELFAGNITSTDDVPIQAFAQLFLRTPEFTPLVKEA